MTADTGTRPPRDVATEQPRLDAEHPWPGLLSFSEADYRYYRGRQTETEELLRLIRRASLTVFFSPSGLGKTSLLQAGVFPPLRQEDFLPVPVRILYAEWSPPAPEQMRRAIKKATDDAAIEAPPMREGEKLWEYFHRRESVFWSVKNYPLTPVLVFDQFEELFTLGPRRGTDFVAAFVQELGDLIEGRAPASVRAMLEERPEQVREFDFSRHRYKVVLTLREDYLPDLEGLRAAIPALMENRLRLLPMTGSQALTEVVAGSGLVAPGVDERIVEMVTGKTGHETSSAPVELALLSLICDELNKKRLALGRQQITGDLLAAGTGEKILQDFYDHSFPKEWPPDVRYFVEDHLLTKDGARDSVALENRPTALTDERLSTLVTRRLLRVEERGGRRRIELSHDVLTGVIKTSRDTRHTREEKEQAEERALRARRQLRRAYSVAGLLGVFMVVAVISGYLAYKEKQQGKRVLATADYRLSLNLIEGGRASMALPYLARALRTDPDNIAARSELLDLLLRRAWPLPGALMRHSGTVWSAVFSPDGRRVLTASADGTARLWDATTGRPIGSPFRHEGGVNSAAFSSDGRRVVTGSDDSTVRVWDAATGDSISAPLRHNGRVMTAAFSLDGERVVTTSDADSTARVWEARTGHALGAPLRHKGAVSAAGFSPDGRLVVTASADSTAQLWDAETGRPIGKPLRHSAGVLSAAFSPDGRSFVTTSWQWATLWDVAQVRALRARRPTAWLGHHRWIQTAAFSPDGRRVVTASDDSTAQVWNATTGDSIRVPLQSLRHLSYVSTAAFSGDGERVLTIAGSLAAEVWNWATGSLVGEPLWSGRFIQSAAFSPDGRRVVTASEDGTARVWDWAVSHPIGELLWAQPAVYRAAFSGDGRRVMTVSKDSTVRVWDVTTGQAVGQPIPTKSRLWSADISFDGQRVATVLLGVDGVWFAQVWDVATGQAVGMRMGHERGVNNAAFSADGRRVVTAEVDSTAQIWDASTGRTIGKPIPHRDDVTGVAFSPDGSRFLTVSNNRTVQVWDTTGQATGKPLSHRGAFLHSARFSADGRRVVTASADGTARVWDATTGDAIGTPLLHTRAVYDAGFSPNGERVVTASADGTARVWNARTGAPIGEPLLHKGRVNSAAFSPDGRRVVTGADDGTARLWNAVTGEAIGEPLLHHAWVRSAAFTPDGLRVVTMSTDSTIHVWAALPGITNDAQLLAKLAEALGAYRIDDAGAVVADSAAAGHLVELRRETSADTGGTARSVIRWFLTDPCARTVSPLSRMPVSEYLEREGPGADAPLVSLCSAAPLRMTPAELPSCSDSTPRAYRLRFEDPSSVYFAHLSLHGCTGTMYVRWRNRTTRTVKVVSQSMRVSKLSTGVVVQGSNPRDSASGRRDTTYLPDNPSFAILPDGSAKIVTCDRSNNCYPVDAATTIKVENRCAAPLTLAAVYADASEGAWMRQGWWTVPPSSTVTTPIQTFADHLYIYSATAGADAGSFMFSVNPKTQFRVAIDEALPRASSRFVGFARVDLRPRSLEYTHVVCP